MDLTAEDLPPGIRRLLEAARTDVDELMAGKAMSRAVDLNRRTGEDFDPSYPPMYFTGDFQAPLVLVHLNPRRAPALAGERFEDFDSYVDAHQNFGKRHWGERPTYTSAFDHKQVRFLRPFGVIDFLPDVDRASKRHNCERVVDRKLQLELLPYASEKF